VVIRRTRGLASIVFAALAAGSLIGATPVGAQSAPWQYNPLPNSLTNATTSEVQGQQTSRRFQVVNATNSDSFSDGVM
jgi:hypothetical protein